MGRQYALQRLHEHENKAAKCAWGMNLQPTGVFARALSQLCQPKAPALPQGLHDLLCPVLPGQFLPSMSLCSC